MTYLQFQAVPAVDDVVLSERQMVREAEKYAEAGCQFAPIPIPTIAVMLFGLVAR